MNFKLGDKVYLGLSTAQTIHLPKDQAFFVVSVVPGKVGLALTPAGKSIGIFSSSIIVLKKPVVSVYDHILDDNE